MKKITKDNKGITLIALIVTVVIMLILVSVTTYSGLDAYRNAQVNKFVAQMQLLQIKIDDLVSTNTTQELNSISLQSVTTEEQKNAITNAFKQGEIETGNMSKYKVFTKDDVLNILNVEDIQDDIMVNFETREIVSVTGIEYKEKIYYTQYKLPGGQTIINDSTETNRDLSFKLDLLLDGLNGTITISNIKITNGTLSYKEKNSDDWTSITNYTEKGKKYTINISKSSNYIFKLNDNLNNENYTEEEILIKLTNKPQTKTQLQEYNYALTSEKWAYGKKDDINYVWVPRFAYNIDNSIKFIKGNSNIATDNTYIDHTFNIPEKFTTDDGIELTGIWVSTENLNQTGLDMITLLNDDTRTILIEI